MIFVYDDIQWTGRALAGINPGDGVSHFTIPGSDTSRMLDIEGTSNVGIPGVWIFRVDRGNNAVVMQTYMQYTLKYIRISMHT